MNYRISGIWKPQAHVVQVRRTDTGKDCFGRKGSLGTAGHILCGTAYPVDTNTGAMCIKTISNLLQILNLYSFTPVFKVRSLSSIINQAKGEYPNILKLGY